MHTAYTTERGPEMCAPDVVKLKKKTLVNPKRNGTNDTLLDHYRQYIFLKFKLQFLT